MNFQYKDGVIETRDLEFDENCGGVGNMYFKCLKKYGDRNAQINIVTDEYDTYTSLLQKCTRTAISLQKRGIQQQDLIAVCSNRQNLNASVVIIAGQFLGCITFSLDPVLTLDECSELIKQVQPKIVFVIDSAKKMITNSLKQTNGTADVVIFGKEFEEEFLKKHENEEGFEPVFIKNLRENCVIHFSSGSTGLPKPICLTHYYFMALPFTTNYSYPSGNNNSKVSFKHVSLRFANWYWVSTSMELFTYSLWGGCRLLMDNFDANEIWRCIDKYKITYLLLTPLQCIELSKKIKPKAIDISSVLDIVTGGYVLHKDYIHALRALFPGTNIYQLYGMTEVGIATTLNTNNPLYRKFLNTKPKSCGMPVNGLCYKVIDIKTGKKCGPNQPGELYLKGKSIFSGFYKKDASESFDKEGYFRTGDYLYFDEDFCFYILDRIKAILGWNDWLIYPGHIEKVLMEHPSVDNAVVIGIPHKIEGERLMGVVILKENANATEEELVKFVDARVQDHKRLREGVRFVREFPLTITGKVNRMKVKEMVLKNKCFFEI